MNPWVRPAALLVLLVAASCTSCTCTAPTHPQTDAHAPPRSTPDPDEHSMSNAQQYINAFERGEDFTPPAQGMITNGEPDPAELERIEKALPHASAAVTENLVTLMVDVALSTDSLKPAGAEVLRHPRTISLLVQIAGRDQPDLAREAAMSALRKLVTPAQLAPHGDIFTQALDRGPSEEAFLLVAKAKPDPAKPVVEYLVGTTRWRGAEEAQIAHAALGDTTQEDRFLEALEQAETRADAEAVTRTLGSLALIGTPRSLRAVAERLRTPLIFSVPGAFEKSVRLNVLEALLYHYPDQPILYPNNIIEESDYTKAEVFCTQTLGVTYSQPPPPFLTYRGAPLPMP
ncbi:MAG: hypothetical protein AAGF11_13135 [Myxococcota bacterium]